MAHTSSTADHRLDLDPVPASVPDARAPVCVEVSDLFPCGDLIYMPTPLVRLVWVRAGITRRAMYHAADLAGIPVEVRNHIRRALGVADWPAMFPDPDRPVTACDIPVALRLAEPLKTVTAAN